VTSSGKVIRTPVSGISTLGRNTQGVRIMRLDRAERVVALAKRFFHDHLAEPGLVSAAADLANLSTRTFSRRFERATGLSPRRFVADKRMERARDLLARTRLTIEEVATRVGYADRSTFSKSFQQRTGISPAMYRRRFEAAHGLTRARERRRRAGVASPSH